MKIAALTLLLALGVAPARALAQPEAQKRDQVRQHISDFVVQRAAQDLGLDAQQSVRFREIWGRYDQQLWAVHREQALAMKELRQLLMTAKPDERRLGQLADGVIRNKAKVQQLEAQRTEELRHVLTVVQFARGLNIAPKLQREVKLQLWKAMHPNVALPPDELE